MSIQSFLNSAETLYDNQKYSEALCLVCIAIDACSSSPILIREMLNNISYF